MQGRGNSSGWPWAIQVVSSCWVAGPEMRKGRDVASWVQELVGEAWLWLYNAQCSGWASVESGLSGDWRAGELAPAGS